MTTTYRCRRCGREFGRDDRVPLVVRDGRTTRQTYTHLVQAESGPRLCGSLDPIPVPRPEGEDNP